MTTPKHPSYTPDWAIDSGLIDDTDYQTSEAIDRDSSAGKGSKAKPGKGKPTDSANPRS